MGRTSTIEKLVDTFGLATDFGPAKVQIYKVSDYAWRCNARFGDAHHATIYGYSIFINGREEVGGFTQGNNCWSGRANCPTLQRARAWVDGYRAQWGNPRPVDTHRIDPKYVTARMAFRRRGSAGARLYPNDWYREGFWGGAYRVLSDRKGVEYFRQKGLDTPNAAAHTGTVV